MKLNLTITALCIFIFFAASSHAAYVIPEFTFYQKNRIKAIKAQIELKNPYFLHAFKEALRRGDDALTHPINAVTNKPIPAASGNKHDYLSLAPYFWPNPNTQDGLPWIRKDGEVNPLTRGENTDQARAESFLNTLGDLFLAYTYTGEKKYAKRAKLQLTAWMLDEKTRMNPNLQYAQGIPGINNGRPFGIIEWEKISNVICIMEILIANEIVDAQFTAQINNWLSKYLNWLLTSELGKLEDSRLNNHANWYDYQTLGLMLYLGHTEKAKLRVEKVKSHRIDIQIKNDGSQPHELKRTKSVTYSTMNLLALTQVAYLSKQLGVDLWAYQGSQGQSLNQAMSYFFPYVMGKKKWKYQQINGGPSIALKKNTLPMMYAAHALAGEHTVPLEIIKMSEPVVSARYRLLYGRLPTKLTNVDKVQPQRL